MDNNKTKEPKDLGWANDWKQRPAELDEAKRNGWEVTETRESMHVYKHVCEKGGWYFRADSSD